ncbi:MAG: hypothetical protein ACJ8DZ_13730 [Allosphingosinicella sp.]
MAKRPRRLCDKGHRVPSGTRANDPCPICAAHVALAARELLSAAGAAQERRYWEDQLGPPPESLVIRCGDGTALTFKPPRGFRPGRRRR